MRGWSVPPPCSSASGRRGCEFRVHRLRRVGDRPRHLAVPRPGRGGHRAGLRGERHPSTPTGTGKSLSSPSWRTRRASPGADAPTTPPRSSDFDRLLDSADGNPLALVELPATLHQPGPTPDWMPVGELIVASFTARMSDLPAPTRRLLLAAALGNDVPLGETCREAHLCASSSPERVAM